MVAIITGRRVKTKDKVILTEVHERIQLTIGMKTCPVKEGGENWPRRKINAREARTLNHVGGMFEAEATKGLSDERPCWDLEHSRGEALHVHNLLHQTESGSDHGLRGGELVASKSAHVGSSSDDELTVARIPKT